MAAAGSVTSDRRWDMRMLFIVRPQVRGMHVLSGLYVEGTGRSMVKGHVLHPALVYAAQLHPRAVIIVNTQRGPTNRPRSACLLSATVPP
jgi:hypothetical protein